MKAGFKILGAFLLLAGLPVLIWAVATQRIELRKHAAENGPTLSINPAVVSSPRGETFSLGILMNTNAASVSAAELHMTYDPTAIEFQNFSPGTVLPVVLQPESHQNGAINVVLGANPSHPFTGANIVGTIKFKTVSSKESSVSFNQATVVTTIGKNVNALVSSTGSRINSSTASAEITASLRPTGTNHCSKNEECPTGQICSATPPDGCPKVKDLMGIERYSMCEGIPKCWTITPTPSLTPTPKTTPCTSDGSRCKITFCPPMPLCPPGHACPQVMPSCITQQGICLHRVCLPITSSPTPTPEPSPPAGCYYKNISCFNPPCARTVVCPTIKPISVPINTPSPTPTPTITRILTPTATPTLMPIHMKFLVKLAGVSGDEARGATMTVKFKLQNGTVLPLDTPLTLSPVGSGVYEATAILSNPMPPGTPMRVLVKGEKHSQVVFCKETKQTSECGDSDYLTTSSYSFDFTGRPLPAGDLNHDGKVDINDIQLITNLFTKPSTQLTPADLKSADVDYSGTIDAYDLNLVIETLETRYDEQ